MNHFRNPAILNSFTTSTITKTWQNVPVLLNQQPQLLFMLNIIRGKKTQLSTTGRVRDLARIPLRVYKAGDELPKPGQKVVINADQIKQELATEYASRLKEKSKPPEKEAVKTASLLFSKIVSEIAENRNRKQIILEGTRLIVDALKAGNKLDYLFLLKSIKDVPEELKHLLNKDAIIHKVNARHMTVWSSVTNPPGIVGICKKPDELQIQSTYEQPIQNQDDLNPLIVICDNIREPGNLGSILRSAAGAGCKKVLLSKGCVDAWQAKVLRGGCGAHFRIPIKTNLAVEALGNFINADEGIDSTMETNSSKRSTGIFLADSNKEDSRSKLPILPYTDINYAEFDEIYLLIGGETEGISNETLKISNQFLNRIHFPAVSKIARIHIPLCQNMESLNAANAFGIILYEIVRQLRFPNKKNV